MNLDEALQNLDIQGDITDKKEIARILNYIGENVKYFQVLQGDAKDFDFCGAKLLDDGEIELYENSIDSTIQINVKELQIYKHINIIRLELNEVAPKLEKMCDDTEEYVELPNKEITHLLTAPGKLVERILKGNLVIITKGKILSRDYKRLTFATKEQFQKL